MKLYLLIYDVDFDEEVMEMLAQCCVTGFTSGTGSWEKGPDLSQKWMTRCGRVLTALLPLLWRRKMSRHL